MKKRLNRTQSKYQQKLVEDVNCRNKFGDYKVVCEDYELAKTNGDFMLYFDNEDTGEIKQLVKIDQFGMNLLKEIIKQN